MTVEFDAAVDEMQALFYSAWNANAGAVFGYVPEVEWYGRENGIKIDRSKVWARVSTQNVTEGQDTLSTCVEVPYQKRYSLAGLIFVQLFLPKTVDNAVVDGRKLAKVARNAFRGKKTDGGVVFYNACIKDVPPEDLFYRFNVVAEYEHDELG